MLKIILDKEELGCFSNHRRTPICYASGEGYLAIVEYLIEKGADVNFTSDVLLRRMKLFFKLSNSSSFCI